MAEKRIILDCYPLPSVEVIFSFKALYSEVKPWAKDKLHWGVDLKAYYENCMSMCPGIVIRATRFDPPGWGRYVIVQHAVGFQVVYAHLSSVAVTEGDKVESGDILGITGASGSAEGFPHLHIELRATWVPGCGPRGQINPLLYVAAQGLAVGGSQIEVPEGFWILRDDVPWLNIRSGPWVSFPIVGRLLPGVLVKEIQRVHTSSWVEIETPSGTSEARFVAINHGMIDFLRTK